MRRIWRVVAVGLVGLGFGLAVVGCDSSTTAGTGKMTGDKMATDKMGSDKMGMDKMAGDKMGNK